MKQYRKQDFPVANVRRFLETGPVVLVSSNFKGEQNIMTMAWHMPLEFTPSLLCCCISNCNHSFNLMKKSKECVINVPTVELLNTVVDIGNCSGATVNKFATFGLTPERGKKVSAPSIRECFANFECKLHDGSKIEKYGLFIWRVVRAQVAVKPRFPKTVHYRGDGLFMVSGREISRRARFSSDKL